MLLADLSFKRFHHFGSQFRKRDQSCLKSCARFAARRRQHFSAYQANGNEGPSDECMEVSQTRRYHSMQVGKVLRIGAHTSIKAAAGSIVNSLEGNDKVL